MAIDGRLVVGSLLRGFALSLAAGLVVGFLGPFGTFEKLPLLWRLSFWVCGIVGGFLFHIPLYWLARYVSETKGWPIWVAIVGSAIVAALPTTFLINGIAVSLLNSVTTDSVLTLYPMVLALSLPLQTIGHLTAFKGRVSELASVSDEQPVEAILPASDPNTPKPISPFFNRLPKRLGQELLCLQMEDHYVRAFTKLGSDMILMRMADAVRELEGMDGLQVHRSFWVARSAIVDWARDGKNLTLKLSNGKNVPVARDRQTQVKAAGWLD
jgi:hypothetical protein